MADKMKTVIEQAKENVYRTSGVEEQVRQTRQLPDQKLNRNPQFKFFAVKHTDSFNKQ